MESPIFFFSSDNAGPVTCCWILFDIFRERKRNNNIRREHRTIVDVIVPSRSTGVSLLCWQFLCLRLTAALGFFFFFSRWDPPVDRTLPRWWHCPYFSVSEITGLYCLYPARISGSLGMNWNGPRDGFSGKFHSFLSLIEWRTTTDVT